MASHADGPSTSASTTMAVNTPLTRRTAATSRPNRFRNSGSAASSARMTFTATGRPPAVHEAEAAALRWYEHALVPGLLQTEAYARAVPAPAKRLLSVSVSPTAR